MVQGVERGFKMWTCGGFKTIRQMWTFDPENLQEIASFKTRKTVRKPGKPRETNTSKTWFATFFLFFFFARLEYLAAKLVCARLVPAACPPR